MLLQSLSGLAENAYEIQFLSKVDDINDSGREREREVKSSEGLLSLEECG